MYIKYNFGKMMFVEYENDLQNFTKNITFHTNKYLLFKLWYNYFLINNYLVFIYYK